MRKAAPLLALCLSISCSEPVAVTPNEEVTLLGSWRFTTEEHSACTAPADNQKETCGGTATDCGILTFTETSWTLVRSGSHGADVSEAGSYSVTGSTISFSGGGPATSSNIVTLTGSSITYSKTLLTFRTADLNSGCTIKISYSRYGKPGAISN